MLPMHGASEAAAPDEVMHAADVMIDGDRIAAIGIMPAGARADRVIDAAGAIVLPGFIQTHVHLCQTLFRGLADDLPLLAWLKQRVWPLEAAMSAPTLHASAQLAAAELLSGGTTTVLTMETVHETEAVFEALAPTGIRAVVGKCLMDVRGDVPSRLYQPLRQGLDESLALAARFHGSSNGRLHAALAPRFALSCTRELLEAVAHEASRHHLLIHTHASEQREEVDAVRLTTGLDNMAYLASVGLASHRLCAAHCVWVTEAEQALMAEHDVQVLHCPGSNLKLGSGIAPVARLRARGINVSIGADGAACNNSLDMFQEMRLAATLQAAQTGPGALPARSAVWMATRGGARALGREADLGSLEPGKKADLVVVDVSRRSHTAPGGPGHPYSTLVYSSRASDVRYTIVDGRVVAEGGAPAWAATSDVVNQAEVARAALLARAGLS